MPLVTLRASKCCESQASWFLGLALRYPHSTRAVPHLSKIIPRQKFVTCRRRINLSLAHYTLCVFSDSIYLLSTVEGKSSQASCTIPLLV